MEKTEYTFDDHFWPNYPRKDDKKKARQKWKRVPKKYHEQIIADIKIRYVGVERQFIPLPTTYLNGERWNDETMPSDKLRSKHSSHRQYVEPEKPAASKSVANSHIADLKKSVGIKR